MMRSPIAQEFLNLRQAVDSLLDDAFVGSPFRTVWQRGGENGAMAYPLPLDVYATNDEVALIAAVPGMGPDDLDISIHQGTVVLSGTIANVAESETAKGATWYLHELPRGQFRRAVTLPFEVDADRAEATFANGIVKITLPKAEQAKPRKIAISVGNGAKAVEAAAKS